ncbi:hypothetical protein K2173_002081 [Erythroxylum novogranatense]|uniref:DUF4005 domain-containing protein n=1 Tax=Erythroxylum novogranatense TaxID=1862640 RepID=A0AAV8SPH5_9ROSI|nr:hypothetical protein K2173_002081 [Erythroxylum novogranatense]
MGKKGKWLSNIKKAFSSETKEKKDEKSNKLKKNYSPEQQQLDSNSTSLGNVAAPSPPAQSEEVKLIESTSEEGKYPYAAPGAMPATSESVFNLAQPTVEVLRIAKVHKFSGELNEEEAAIMIQTTFRGYLARRALRALRGLFRLKSLMEGPTVKRQAVNTLRCMQALARVQSQIHNRRIRMSEENQALQRQLLQKHAKELENLRMKEEWDDSLHSKEQIEANLLSKYEAAMRRERALAYAFSHQKTGKNPRRSANTMFMNPGNPTWGWSWFERWMAAHPWDGRSMADKEFNDHSSVKSASLSVGGEIMKSYARYQLNSDYLSPSESEKPSQTVNLHSPSTPLKPASTVARKWKSASPRSSTGGQDDDSRSMVSLQSRRHSIAGSVVQDNVSLASSSTVPSYMVPTESARAKSRLQSPLGLEKNGTTEREKVSAGPVKKRLSYPPSPARLRRHPGLPKIESNFTAQNTMIIGEGV